jgi:ABC-type glycerol-3-phosphate transport system permease component
MLIPGKSVFLSFFYRFSDWKLNRTISADTISWKVHSLVLSLWFVQEAMQTLSDKISELSAKS